MTRMKRTIFEFSSLIMLAFIAVMLSEAKHPWLSFGVSFYFRTDPRLFASLRMT
jgi:hypothetical protein